MVRITKAQFYFYSLLLFLCSFHQHFLYEGLGNLAGEMDFWDVNRKKIMGSTSSHCAVAYGWSPDGRWFLTATCAPRMNVDNDVKVCFIIYYVLRSSILFLFIYQAFMYSQLKKYFEVCYCYYHYYCFSSCLLFFFFCYFCYIYYYLASSSVATCVGSFGWSKSKS